MSGICGLWHLDGRSLSRRDLVSMVGGLVRRAPDGSHVWHGGCLGFGHAQLLTTPESTADQMPLTNGDGSITITADVRLDNRPALLHALGARGRTPEKVSDTRLILEAYEKWGETCPEHLLGDFAFAVWDRRRRVVFCARDHLGVKPFYYHRSGRFFAFASDLGALLRVPGVSRGLDHGRIADFLLVDMEGLDKTSTSYRDIVRLPPAHGMTVSAGRAAVWSYWSVERAPGVDCRSDRDYADAFRQVFSEAVRSRLRNASGVGSMLSGGIDSSAVVGVGRQLLKDADAKPLHTFSAVSPAEAACRETRCIDQVIAQGDVQPHAVRVDQLAGIRHDLRYLWTHAAEPFDLLTPMPLIQSMYIAARRRGIRVLLDGAASDVVTSVGRGYLSYLLRTGRWTTAMAEAFATSRLWADESPGHLLMAHARTAFVPPRLRQLWQKIRGPARLRDVLQGTAISSAFAQRVDLLDRLRERQKLRRAIPSDLQAAHACAVNQPFLTSAFERYDRVASAYSVERRDPFCDKRVVEFCVALPWHQKVHHGWSKVLLRRSMSGVLPAPVCWRRTCDHLGWRFTRAWMRLESDLVQHTLSNLEDVSEFIDVSTVTTANRRHVNGEAGEDDQALLWQVMALSVWLSSTSSWQPMCQRRMDEHRWVPPRPVGVAAVA